MKKKLVTAAVRDWAEADESSLVSAAHGGEEKAFEELFRRFRKKVFNLAYRFTRDYDEALDITQEVFLKIFKSIKGYRKEAGLLTWICKIAMNTCIDRYRTKGAQSEVDFKDEIDTTGGSGMLTPRKDNPTSALLRKELGEKIDEAITKLSPKHRSVFILHVEEGFSYKEIAEMSKCSIGTVMSRLHHARRYLRNYLSKYLEAAGERDEQRM